MVIIQHIVISNRVAFGFFLSYFNQFFLLFSFLGLCFYLMPFMCPLKGGATMCLGGLCTQKNKTITVVFYKWLQKSVRLLKKIQMQISVSCMKNARLLNIGTKFLEVLHFKIKHVKYSCEINIIQLKKIEKLVTPYKSLYWNIISFFSLSNYELTLLNI